MFNVCFSFARREALNALCVYAIQYAVKQFMIDINVIDPDHYRENKIKSAIKKRRKEITKRPFPQTSLSYQPPSSSYDHQLPELLYLGIRVYSNARYGPNKDIYIGPESQTYYFLEGNKGLDLLRWIANVARAAGLQPEKDGKSYPSTHRSVKGYLGVDFSRFNLT